MHNISAPLLHCFRAMKNIAGEQKTLIIFRVFVRAEIVFHHRHERVCETMLY